ncbi:O-antigen ligase family protein [Aequorivita echinoideorum]|uniref:O-antigen ligase family protein n=1 Tax=Aequorivita echinoideorum TaxID=1549647 RepID=A0ABS5S1U9_9FLAO|nr:O-antigen ligase family protein [Aequorivita echinoideorum]MBT0607164.1 O-antigen ligase family protein [Aequorivita echinoideorum]
MRILLAAIYPYAFLLLYFIIPFDDHGRIFPNILLALLVVAFPFIVKKNDFKKLKSWSVAILFLLCAYLLINSTLAGRIDSDFKIISKVLLSFGLVILYIPIADVRKLNSAIIFSSLVAIIYSVYNFVLITHETGSFALGESPQVVESLLVDRLYLGLLSTFSILISFLAIKKKFHPNNNYYLANIIINLVFIILIASKISIIVLTVLFLIRQFYGKKKVWKMVAASLALAALVGFFGVMKYEKQAFNKLKPGEGAPNFIENSITWEIRTVVWQCAEEIIRNEGFTLTGAGFYETKDKLVSCYDTQIIDKATEQKFISQRYNTHSQFIDFYLSAGFIAFFLFVLFIILNFIQVHNYFLPTAMLAILVMYCSVENVFQRQIGAYYMGFILIVLATSITAGTNNEIKKS